MKKADWYKEIPEWECVDAGDPFIAEIVKGDDIIDDHLFNYELLGLAQPEARAVARRIEALRTEYEIETLDRWILL